VRVFVSYSTPDLHVAEGLLDALKPAVAGLEPYFAPRSNVAGIFWIPRLGEEIAAADVLLLLLGANVGSWQELEYYEAFRLNKQTHGRPRVVPVLLGCDCPGLAFLHQFHRVHGEGKSPLVLAGELATLLAGADAASGHAEPWRDTNPYRGLHAMGTDSAAFFFGRETVTAQVLEALRQTSGQMLALVGNSGVGKSSIVQAGVLAALRSRLWPGAPGQDWPTDLNDSHTWLMVSLKPGQQPLKELALAFTRTWLTGADSHAEATKWLANFKAGCDLADLVNDTFYQLNQRGGAPARLLLYIDQGEELYSHAEKTQAARFSELVAQGCRMPGLSVLASLRADYYGHLQADAPLFAASKRIDIPPPTVAELHDIITRPAALLSAQFAEPALVERIAQATAQESGGLALLAFMMTDAWQAMRRDGAGLLHLPIEVVDIGRPLIDRAETFLRQHPQHEGALRRLLTLRLAHVPKEGEPVRRRVTQAECQPAEWALAQQLASPDWRLLTLSDSGGVLRAEVAHETLLRKWPRLAGWLDAERGFLVWHGQLDQARRAWQEAPPDKRDAALLMGLSLETARFRLAERGEELSDVDRAFVADSIARDDAAQAQAAEQQRSLNEARDRAEQRRWWLSRISVAAALVFAVLAGWIGWQVLEADELNASLEIQLFETRVEQARMRMSFAEQQLEKGLADEALAIMAQAFPPELRTRWQGLMAASGPLWKPYKIVEQSHNVMVLRGHTNMVTSAVFSPDGTRILTASWDSTARLWDAATGAETAVLRGHEGTVTSAVFSPDGARILTASRDKTARLWDTATGAETAVLRGHEGTVTSAVFSPDGTRILTASWDNTARLWDAATGAETAVLRGHESLVTSAVFSPDGTRILTASVDNTALLWDAATGAETAVLRGHEDSVRSAVFSPDGTRILTASNDTTARLWDAATGAETAVLRGQESDVNSAVFSPDGTRLLTASDDNTARLWDAATGAETAVLRGHESSVRSAVFSPDGTRILTASDDNTARLWDAATGAGTAVLRGHEDSVNSAVFSPDGTRILTASDDNTARLWDAATGAQIAVLRGHENIVRSAVFSPDGTRILTASYDNTARLWDAATGAQTAVLRGHERTVTSAVFSPDGTRILTASGDTTARLWDAATGAQTAVLRGHERDVSSAIFSPDGTRILTASRDNTARLWDAATGAETAVLRGQESDVNSAVFSPDGTRILTASGDTTARLWDAATGAETAVLRGHESDVKSAVFSPDGTRILTASGDRTARLWDAATGAETAVLRGHEDWARSAVFSPDGTRILTASDDTTARLWDVATGAETAVLRGHESLVISAVFSPDGTRILTASWDKTARLWTVNAIPTFEQLIDRARAQAERAHLLSPQQECAFFLRSDGC
jgi:WD40 repeat protein